MTPEQLREVTAILPTIFSLNEELSHVRELQALDIADIEQDLPSFVALIQTVQLSHADNGVFETGEAEEAQAVDFFQWLESLEPKLGVPLTPYADGLDLTRAELAKRMPR